MEVIIVLVRTAMFLVGTALGYTAVTWPLFARRLVSPEGVLLDHSDKASVRPTRWFMFGLVALGWLTAVVIGLALQRELQPFTWVNFGFPFAIGWAFAMFAVPVRLWYRLLPWRG